MHSRMIFPMVLCAMAFALTVGCKDTGTTEPSPIDTTSWPPVVRKPNIYLYPEHHQRISVQLVFPLGGRVLESEPHYGRGWLVDVDPDGRISGRYDYLFYEAQVPDRYQYSQGWIVRRDSLAAFFVRRLAQAGFNRREIADFTSYWVPLLSRYPAIEVYPQQRRVVEALIQLKVTPAPQHQLRLFFVIRPNQDPRIHLTPPRLSPAIRAGYHLAEWGVILE